MKTFTLEEIYRSPCPHLLNDFLVAGQYANGAIQLPDDQAAAILAKCQGHTLRGLGDVVALVAQPIARAIDKVVGTDLKHCGGCHGPNGRQARLNRMVPFGDTGAPMTR